MKLVIYHAQCYDGFGSAWAAYRKLGTKGVKYVPVGYGDKALPEIGEDVSHVYVLDFSFPKEVLLDWSSRARVTVLDHHDTAQKRLEPLVGRHRDLEIVFDMTRSGALITWEYFHEDDGDGYKPAPALIKYISDRDLWNFDLPFSREVHMALVSYPMDFRVWDGLNVEQLIKEGQTCSRLYGQIVEKICSHAWMTYIDGHGVPTVNTSVAWSEVAHRLLEIYPDAPFATCFTSYSDHTKFSLRGRGDFRVNDVAEKFGGGGHPDAAGFELPRSIVTTSEIRL